MDKDLMIKQDDQLALNHAELLKPLISDIYLFDTYIANTAVNNNREAIDRLTVGTELSLRREVNKFEESAIAVMDAGGDKIGYIPEKDTVIFARLMDAGGCLISRREGAEGITRKMRRGNTATVSYPSGFTLRITERLWK